MNRKLGDISFYGIVLILSLATLAILIVIIAYVMRQGLPHISWEFLSQSPEHMGREGGILPIIVGTVFVTLLALAIATPIGVGAAVFFAEYSKEGRVVQVIRTFTEVLAGIPSIIFGLFGFAFFVVFMQMGWSILSGGLSLSLMILPTIIRSTEESLKTVPLSYREGSLSLGATKWETTVKVVLPCCRKGILTGLILGIGRAVGETAVLYLTIGGSIRIPTSLFDPARTMSMHMYMMTAEGISREKSFATAALLIVIILIVNSIANFISNRMKGAQ
ncbi:MAG: phosphate ABC transporter permease PstA [Clostridiales Family XIII bacterium]|jgi:phosphate transport system permease protein|nr:phosphate ABC transporter permease PstA [Clostridiales Family XIII bacterium]